MYYCKYIPQITQPSKYRCTQLQYRFAVISEAPNMYIYYGRRVSVVRGRVVSQTGQGVVGVRELIILMKKKILILMYFTHSYLIRW